jgi:hypothetical protein
MSAKLTYLEAAAKAVTPKAAKKVSIETTVMTDEGSAKSTDGGNFKIIVPMPYLHEVPCIECNNAWCIYNERAKHTWDCPSYRAWVKQDFVKRDENPNTCETCNADWDRPDHECRHFTAPDFAEVVVSTEYDEGVRPSVYFTTTTTKVEELLPLMEKAYAWVMEMTHKMVRQQL